MTNFSAKIIGNAVSGLQAQQAVIAATSSNIANLNTPGYVRRQVDLQTRVSGGASEGLNIGNGVEVSSLRRLSDEFLERSLREAVSGKASLETQDDYLKRVESLFNLTGDVGSIGTGITNFFTSLNDLAANPASLELRQVVINRMQELTNSINNTYTTVAELQAETERRLDSELQVANSLASQVAELNGLISGREAGGQIAADERDRRDQLLSQLSEKLSFTTLELPDGQVNVTFPSGFPLIAGTTARPLELDTAPSFRTGSGVTGLNGSTLGWVTYDFDPGGGKAQIDLTQTLQAGGGSIGGLLKLRGYADPTAANTTPFNTNGPLVEVAKRVEALARTLLTTVNQRYTGTVDEDPTTATFVDSNRGDLNGARATAYGLFGLPTVGTADLNNNGLADDLTALPFVSFAANIRPGTTDPRAIAAAVDTDPTAGTVSFQQGDNRNLLNTAGTNDDLTDLQNDRTLVFSLGGYSVTGSFQDFYDELVTYVGNESSRAEVNLSVARETETAAANRRDQAAAVSLDEEFSNLIRFQTAFQASARMIKAADEILQTIVGLI